MEDYERENVYGESEVRLLTTVAASMGVALENARLFDETQRLFKESEQRAAELAIINSVQQALAAELNMQGIYDAVGDKIREIFGKADLDIRILDPQAGVTRFPYVYDHGERIEIAPQPISKTGFARHVYTTKQTLVVNEHMAEQVVRFGARTIPGTQMEKSAVYVPLVWGGEARGMVSISDYEQENAFSDSDVRLLETLAGSADSATDALLVAHGFDFSCIAWCARGSSPQRQSASLPAASRSRSPGSESRTPGGERWKHSLDATPEQRAVPELRFES